MNMGHWCIHAWYLMIGRERESMTQLGTWGPPEHPNLKTEELTSLYSVSLWIKSILESRSKWSCQRTLAPSNCKPYENVVRKVEIQSLQLVVRSTVCLAWCVYCHLHHFHSMSRRRAVGHPVISRPQRGISRFWLINFVDRLIKFQVKIINCANVVEMIRRPAESVGHEGGQDHQQTISMKMRERWDELTIRAQWLTSGPLWRTIFGT